ncbi:hypothetical protein AB9P05_22620 [Roseivirga sp. BDSF3-8]|uniref:hypothetical protein n=1 Tax=Roseivirga sp. BDSF3-8 TaxID=3241598 RepID=UPI0035322452
MKRIAGRCLTVACLCLLPIFSSGFTFPDFPGNSEEAVLALLSDVDIAEYQESLIGQKTPAKMEVLVYNQSSDLVFKQSFDSGEEASRDKKLLRLLRKCDVVVKSESSVLYMLK